jgi:hypothetical protein
MLLSCIIAANRITAHADISYLDLKDVDNQLGLPQDALDNLGNLGKEIILKAAASLILYLIFHTSLDVKFRLETMRWSEAAHSTSLTALRGCQL